MVITRELDLATQGFTDIQDITTQIQLLIRESELQAGIVTIFCPGSTGGLTTIEYENGALRDFQEVLENLAPLRRDYHHHLRWGDDNGSSHIRAALVGPSLTVPFVGGRLTLGTWQQLIFLDFDTRPRSRKLVVQIMGE
ncbi:MAG: YjbQ family protein [Anaerolineae bacterium]|nr:YjbQ family protein [Anaerolineae bacterium]